MPPLVQLSWQGYHSTPSAFDTLLGMGLHMPTPMVGSNTQLPLPLQRLLPLDQHPRLVPCSLPCLCSTHLVTLLSPHLHSSAHPIVSIQGSCPSHPATARQNCLLCLTRDSGKRTQQGLQLLQNPLGMPLLGQKHAGQFHLDAAEVLAFWHP